MAQRPINININYNASVTRALQAGDAILKQMEDLAKIQSRQLNTTNDLLTAVERLGVRGADSINRATQATRRWGVELTRIGVFVNKTFASISGAVTSFGNQVGRVLGSIGTGIGGAGGTASSFIGSFTQSIADFVGTGGFVQQLGNAVATGTGGIIRVGTKIGEALIKGVGTALSQLPKIFGNLLQISGALGGLAAGIGGSFFKAGGLAAGLFVTGFTNAAGAVVGSFGDILQGITSIASNVFSSIGGIVAESIEGAVNIVGAFADRAAAIIGDTAGKLGEIFGKTFAVAAGIAIPVGFKAASFRDQLGSTFGVVVDELDQKGFQVLVDRAKDVAVEVGVSLSEIRRLCSRPSALGSRGQSRRSRISDQHLRSRPSATFSCPTRSAQQTESSHPTATKSRPSRKSSSSCSTRPGLGSLR